MVYQEPVPNSNLTTIQKRLLALLQEKVDRGEPLPTYREICSKFGWASTGTARDHLRALAQKGHLHLSGGRARAATLNTGRAVSVTVPIVGSVAAGLPVEVQDVGGDLLPVPSEWVGTNHCFAIRVSGDSMRDAGILDGDYVVAKTGSGPADGDIVVATVNGETTLKRLRRLTSKWLLVPENSRYKPIAVSSESAVIQGVMVGLLRSQTVRTRGAVPRHKRNPKEEVVA